MKTILFLVMLCSLAVAAPPAARVSQGQRIQLHVDSAVCKKCLRPQPELMAYSIDHNMINDGAHKPRVTAERYEYRCRWCGETWRKIIVLPQPPPMP